VKHKKMKHRNHSRRGFIGTGQSTRLPLLLAFICFVYFMPLGFAADLAVLHNGFSIRHERREVVGTVTRLYLGKDKNGYVDVPTADIDHFEPDLAPQPAAQNPARTPDLIAGASDRYHLDPDLVNSVIRAESGFNAKAVSPKGAQGLMQLMPATASKLGVSNAFDPGANVNGGTRYLRELLERYNFDLIKALAAYNAGPQRVAQYHGVPPYYETQAYVARIVRDFNRKKLAEEKAQGASNSGTQKKPTQNSGKPIASQPTSSQ
jgi:soluble lytic murein transglycosylase-like protein